MQSVANPIRVIRVFQQAVTGARRSRAASPGSSSGKSSCAKLPCLPSGALARSRGTLAPSLKGRARTPQRNSGRWRPCSLVSTSGPRKKMDRQISLGLSPPAFVAPQSQIAADMLLRHASAGDEIPARYWRSIFSRGPQSLRTRRNDGNRGRPLAVRPRRR